VFTILFFLSFVLTFYQYLTHSGDLISDDSLKTISFLSIIMSVVAFNMAKRKELRIEQALKNRNTIPSISARLRENLEMGFKFKREHEILADLDI
jgi:hypothetical protein